MPDTLLKSNFDSENVEGIINNCVNKLHSILYRLRSVITEEDRKVLQEIIESQKTIKECVKLVLEHKRNQELENIDHDDITKSLLPIGHGAFGDVFKAKTKGSTVAVKVLHELNSSATNEVKILRLLRHDNIVAYRGMVTLRNEIAKYNLKEGSCMIVMEYIPDNLCSHVDGLKSPEVKGLLSSQVWDFAEQIMSGLYYLHSFSIAHRDLKPDNILLEKGVKRMRLKLADFGLAFHHKKSNDINAKLHNRWCAPEIFESNNCSNVESFMKSDIFSFGLVLHFMISGDKPWAYEFSHAVQLERSNFDLPEYPENIEEDGPLRKLYEDCLIWEPNDRPTAYEVIENTFEAHQINPYTVTMQTSEFFTCGFLKNTKIVIADSLVDESMRSSGTGYFQGYPRDCLLCELEADDERDDKRSDEMFHFFYNEDYLKRLNYWRNAAKDNKIDDNVLIALSDLTTPREGEDEEQRVVLKMRETRYVHHRAMRDVWKSFDEKTQNEHLPCKTSVHRHFSTSFGLHIAVITADGMFIFTSRAKRDGIAGPGILTCGAVESCSTNDYVKKVDGKTYVDLVKTSARGLNEELGINLQGSDLDAICLTTVYLKYDNHEWGMCGFVNLLDERIAADRRLTFSSINSRFSTGACKDKFEHDRFIAVPFNKHEMAQFVRDNSDNFASSTKVVVVKVMQAYFGVMEVEQIFKAMDASG
ncbi:mitogen-activated protein kinase kinase kinase dlk-1-like [Xenia sp. Carnegie-2017]|uniref:mitogen-activated protein kinase kinase kinase dlk-1-like n=1 Tax=Xenia sp. Carnegie-2017 TaxID=2897299 RepID=UPI001F04BDE0|nr:mitogen-activated protein kinase kinase kinase dlk-1-like [Xenia sp. Carnegie-2017]